MGVQRGPLGRGPAEREGEALGTHWSGKAESQEGGGEALGPRGWLGGRWRLLPLRGQG